MFDPAPKALHVNIHQSEGGFPNRVVMRRFGTRKRLLKECHKFSNITGVFIRVHNSIDI